MLNLNTDILLKYILKIRLCYELDTIKLQFTMIPIHYLDTKYYIRAQEL